MNILTRTAGPLAAAAVVTAGLGGQALAGTPHAPTKPAAVTKSSSATKAGAAKHLNKRISYVRISVVGGKRIITDKSGHALYVFLKDKPGQMSACKADCLNVWTPTKGTHHVYRSPLTKAKVRTTADHQVTINGQRAYYFNKDMARTAKGQGVKGVWYVFAPDGHLIKSDIK